MAYCVHDELPGDCRICSETGDMMPGDTPAAPTTPRCLRCGARWVHRDDYAGLGTPHKFEDSEARSTPAEALDVERLVADIEAIDHPCHDVCIGNLHADCQCAAWIRQEVLLLLSRPSDKRVPESDGHAAHGLSDSPSERKTGNKAGKVA